jgi:hypothetical protein
MDPASWSISTALPFNNAWIPNQDPRWGTSGAYLEGNMVLGPNGTLYDILRVNNVPGKITNTAAMVRYDPESNSLAFERFIDLPGGHTKFVIHQEPVHGFYLTLR